MDLAAMMRLVIEEMREDQPQRRLMAVAGYVRIGEWTVEAALGDAPDDVDEVIVLGLAGDAQRDEVAVEDLVERDLRIGLVPRCGRPRYGRRPGDG